MVLAGNFSRWKNVKVEFNGDEALLVKDLTNRGANTKLLYCLANIIAEVRKEKWKWWPNCEKV